MTTDYGHSGWGIGIRFPAGAKNISVHNAKIISGINSFSHLRDQGLFLMAVKWAMQELTTSI
jgi:hypothetical protein